MAKPAVRFQSCYGLLCSAKTCKSCCKCVPYSFYWAPKLFFFRPSPSRLSPGRNTVFVPVERIVQSLASFPHWGIKREHGPVRSPSSPSAMLHWALKLPRGTFWASLKTFKMLAAAFAGLRTAQLAEQLSRLPSGQAGFEPQPAVCQRWQDQRHTN